MWKNNVGFPIFWDEFLEANLFFVLLVQVSYMLPEVSPPGLRGMRSLPTLRAPWTWPPSSPPLRSALSQRLKGPFWLLNTGYLWIFMVYGTFRMVKRCKMMYKVLEWLPRNIGQFAMQNSLWRCRRQCHPGKLLGGWIRRWILVWTFDIWIWNSASPLEVFTKMVPPWNRTQNRCLSGSVGERTGWWTNADRSMTWVFLGKEKLWVHTSLICGIKNYWK